MICAGGGYDMHREWRWGVCGVLLGIYSVFSFLEMWVYIFINFKSFHSLFLQTHFLFFLPLSGSHLDICDTAWYCPTDIWDCEIFSPSFSLLHFCLDSPHCSVFKDSQSYFLQLLTAAANPVKYTFDFWLFFIFRISSCFIFISISLYLYLPLNIKHIEHVCMWAILKHLSANSIISFISASFSMGWLFSFLWITIPCFLSYLVNF